MAAGTASASHQLHLTVITPARAVLDTVATSVVVPAFDGELGILPGHADLLALLGQGVLRMKTPDGTVKRMAIRGGFLQVQHNTMTVLTPESMTAAELKPELLKEERAKLDAEKTTKVEELDLLQNRREWLKARERTLQAPAASH